MPAIQQVTGSTDVAARAVGTEEGAPASAIYGANRVLFEQLLLRTTGSYARSGYHGADAAVRALDTTKAVLALLEADANKARAIESAEQAKALGPSAMSAAASAVRDAEVAAARTAKTTIPLSGFVGAYRRVDGDASMPDRLELKNDKGLLKALAPDVDVKVEAGIIAVGVRDEFATYPGRGIVERRGQAFDARLLLEGGRIESTLTYSGGRPALAERVKRGGMEWIAKVVNTLDLQDDGSLLVKQSTERSSMGRFTLRGVSSRTESARATYERVAD